MTTHYTSRKQIEAHQRAKLDQLDRERKFAQYENPDTPAINYRVTVRERGYTADAATCPETVAEAHFLKDQYLFLCSVRQRLGVGLSAHYATLGWGREKGNRVLRGLTALHCLNVQKEKLNPRGGKPRKIPSLTPIGKELLEAYEQRTRNS